MLAIVVDNRFASAQRSDRGFSVLDDAKKVAVEAVEHWWGRRGLPVALYSCAREGATEPVAVLVSGERGALTASSSASSAAGASSCSLKASFLRSLRGLRADGRGGLEDAVLSAMGWRAQSGAPAALLTLVLTGPTHGFSRSRSWSCGWQPAGQATAGPGLLCSLGRSQEAGTLVAAGVSSPRSSQGAQDAKGRDEEIFSDAARLHFTQGAPSPAQVAREMPYHRLEAVYARVNSSFHGSKSRQGALSFSNAEYDSWSTVFKARRSSGEVQRTAGALKQSQLHSKAHPQSQQNVRFLWRGVIAGLSLASPGDGYAEVEEEREFVCACVRVCVCACTKVHRTSQLCRAHPGSEMRASTVAGAACLLGVLRCRRPCLARSAFSTLLRLWPRASRRPPCAWQESGLSANVRKEGDYNARPRLLPGRRRGLVLRLGRVNGGVTQPPGAVRTTTYLRWLTGQGMLGRGQWHQHDRHRRGGSHHRLHLGHHRHRHFRCWEKRS